MNFFHAVLRNALVMMVPILLLLALRAVWGRRVRPAAMVAAWVVVLVGLLLPWRPSLPWPALPLPTSAPMVDVDSGAPVPTQLPRAINQQLRQAEEAQQADSPMLPLVQSTTPIQPGTSSGFRLSWPTLWQWALALWVIGMAGVVAWQATRHLRFARLYRRWGRSADARTLALYARVGSDLGIRRPPLLWPCACVPSPMLAGLFRPRLLLPEPESFTDEELTYILRHELTHYARHDLWVKALLLAAMTLYWFNPLLYVLARALSADLEMACDDAALRGAIGGERRRYGETILAVITRQQGAALALSTHFYEGRKSMKKRFQSMLDTAPRRGGSVLVLSLLVLCLLTGSVLANTQPTDIPEASSGDFIPTTAAIQVDERLVELTPPSPLVNRSLTPAEGERLYQLYYQYIALERRPVQEVRAEDAADAFTLSVPLSEYVAYVNREAPWMVPEGPDFYPWLRFSDREMTDEELLALIELQEAFNTLAPWEDPYADAVRSNRSMTWREQYRYAQLEAAYEQDDAVRPASALPDVAGEGLYLLGHNGGGERVYHYPEARELTDEELLQMIHIRQMRMAQSSSENQNWMDQLLNGEIVGKEVRLSDADALILAKQAVAEVYGVDAGALVWGNGHFADTDIPNWQFEAFEKVPVFAPAAYYSVSIADTTGFALSLYHDIYWNGYYLEDQVMFPLLWAAAPRYQAKDLDGPLWQEKLNGAMKLMDLPTDPVEVETGGLPEWPSFAPALQYHLVFADGSRYFLDLDGLTGELKSLSHSSGPVVNQ